MQNTLQLNVHEAIRYSRDGWNNYLSPFIGMAYYITVPELVIAKLFPEFLVGSSFAAVVSFFIIAFMSYRLGIRHEKIEKSKKGESDG